MWLIHRLNITSVLFYVKLILQGANGRVRNAKLNILGIQGLPNCTHISV